jgi:polyhydroxybutyrate depolymerase
VRHFLPFIVFSIGFVQLASAAPLVERTWTVDGVERQALVHAPEKAKEMPTPVVFAFHGHGGNMRNASRQFGYETLWPEAIVVYMQGLKTPGRLTDPEGRKNGWQHAAGNQGDRDLKFFDAVLASLKKDYKVDEKRIYATGHSNGGGFTYLLWAKRGDVFAAVAPSGSVATRYAADLKPKPVLHVAGKNDPLVKFAWQSAGLDAVKKINGCEEKGQPWSKSGDLVGTEYKSPKGTPVVTLISPGNHKFPSEAPALIVKFFKEQVKPVE